MSTYGYKPAANAPATGTAFGLSASSNQRAYVENKTTKHLWVYALSGQCGKPSSGAANPTVTWGLWATDSGQNPIGLLGRTGSFAVSAVKTGDTDGQWYTQNTQAPVQLWNGQRYALGLLAINANLNFGMIQAAFIQDKSDNLNFYTKNRDNAAPSTPFAADYAEPEGHIALYALCDDNVPPTVPGNLSPAANSFVQSQAPTFAADFRDGNETLTGGRTNPGEKLKQFRVIVTTTGGAAVWDSGWKAATSAMQAARRFTLAYTGPTLSQGATYRWRCAVTDQFDAQSAWTADTAFTVNGGGSLVNLTPAGKQKSATATTPGPFKATWSHAGGLKAKAAKVRLLDPVSDKVLAESPAISLGAQVSPGGTISVTWADTGFAALQLGAAYRWQLIGQDTSNLWVSYNASPPQALSINAAPTIPVQLQPNGGLAFAQPPKLVLTCTDADDTPASGFVVYAELLHAAGTVYATKAMNQRPGAAAMWELPLAGADLPDSYATYRWRAYATDGSLYSGGASTAATATRSAEASFVYAQGPEVEITAPADGDTVTTAQPLIQWTVSNQVKYQVVLRDPDTQALVWDSGLQVSSVVRGRIVDGGLLRQGQAVVATVAVTDSNNLVGVSPPITFTLLYPPPAVLAGFRLTPYLRPGDLAATAVQVSWEPSQDPHFARYFLFRRPVDEVAAGPNDQLIAELTSPADISFIDDRVPSQRAWTYAAQQMTTPGIDTLVSDRAEATIRLGFEQAVLQDAYDPARRVVMVARTGERDISRNRKQEMVLPWNQVKPIHYQGTAFWKELKDEYVIVGATPAEVEAHIAALDELDQGGGPLMYRDGRGRLLYGAIIDNEEVDPPGGRLRRVRLGFRELTFTERAVVR